MAHSYLVPAPLTIYPLAIPSEQYALNSTMDEKADLLLSSSSCERMSGEEAMFSRWRVSNNAPRLVLKVSYLCYEEGNEIAAPHASPLPFKTISVVRLVNRCLPLQVVTRLSTEGAGRQVGARSFYQGR